MTMEGITNEELIEFYLSCYIIINYEWITTPSWYWTEVAYA